MGKGGQAMSPVFEGMRWRPANEFFYLSMAAICLNCHAVFEARPRCLACTSESVQSVETYCMGRRGQQREARVREDGQAFEAAAVSELKTLHALKGAA